MIKLKLLTLICASLFLLTNLLFAQKHKAHPIGYSTVAKALKSLKNNASSKVRVLRKWTVITDSSKRTWSFAPKSHPAYPSVVRREIIIKNGRLFVQSIALCETKKIHCDRLKAQFKKIDVMMQKAIDRKLK